MNSLVKEGSPIFQIMNRVFTRAVELNAAFFIIVRDHEGFSVSYYNSDEGKTGITIDPIKAPGHMGNACFDYVGSVSGIDTAATSGGCIQNSITTYLVGGVDYHLNITFMPSKVVGHEFIIVTFID